MTLVGSSQPMVMPGQYTVATLPTATNNKGILAWVTDDPTLGFCPYYSNGSGWASMQGATGAQGPQGAQGPSGVTGLQTTKLVTNGSGQVTWTFSPAYISAPTISWAVENSGSAVVMGITAISNTSVTVGLKRAQTLPASLTLITQLISFDIFAGASISGVTIHLMAQGT